MFVRSHYPRTASICGHHCVELDGWQLFGRRAGDGGLGLGVVLLCAGSPFWILRASVHMRIVPRTADELTIRNAPLRLLDMFGMLAFVAVPLGLLRVISPNGFNPSMGLAIGGSQSECGSSVPVPGGGFRREQRPGRRFSRMLLVSELAALTGAFVFPWVEPTGRGHVPPIRLGDAVFSRHGGGDHVARLGEWIGGPGCRISTGRKLAASEARGAGASHGYFAGFAGSVSTAVTG